jgi:hypothetical protein
MLSYLPELATLRSFADRVYGLFEVWPSAHRAKCRRAALLRSAEFAAVPELAGARGMLTKEKFAKMIAFLASPAGQRVRTNNHVERTNRRLRFLEKVRYKWRRRTLVRFVVLTLDLWRRNDQSEAQVATAGAKAANPPDDSKAARNQPFGMSGTVRTARITYSSGATGAGGRRRSCTAWWGAAGVTGSIPSPTSRMS